MNILKFLESEQFNNSHNLYVVSTINAEQQRIVKVGYSGEIKKRLKSYYSHNPYTEVVATFKSDKALELEIELHEKIPKIDSTTEWHPYELLESITTLIRVGIIKEQVNILEKDMYIKVYKEITSIEKEVEETLTTWIMKNHNTDMCF